MPNQLYFLLLDAYNICLLCVIQQCYQYFILKFPYKVIGNMLMNNEVYRSLWKIQYLMVFIVLPIYVQCESTIDGLKWVHTKKLFQVTDLLFANNVNTSFYLLFWRFNQIFKIWKSWKIFLINFLHTFLIPLLLNNFFF